MKIRFKAVASLVVGAILVASFVDDFRDKAARVERRATVADARITVYQPDEGLYVAWLPRRCVVHQGAHQITLRMSGNSQDTARIFVDATRHELLLGQGRSHGFLVNTRTLRPEGIDDGTYLRLAQSARFRELP